MVLPGSAEQLSSPTEDEKVILFRVVIMKHIKDDFMSQVRSKFKGNSKEYDEDEILRMSDEKKEKQIIENEIKKQKVSLIKTSEAGFSELYTILLHLKVNFSINVSI